MNLTLSLLLLAVSLSLSRALRLQLSLKAVKELERLRGKSKALAETHQDLTMVCFDKYNPKLSSIVTQYQYDYDACIKVYDMDKKNIDVTYTKVQNQLENDAYSSCQSLKSCEQFPTAFERFNCASTRAADDSKIFYEISKTATENAEKIKSQYSNVERTRNICVNSAESTYVEDTGYVYSQLNGCLAGKEPVGPPTVPTTPRPRDTDSTDDDVYYTTP